MTGIHSYSTTASENVQANTGINWDEGMPPSAVNNSARQNMADMRLRANDAAWFQYGVGSKAVTATYSSGTAITLVGGDATSAWHAGRRVKAVGSSTGTIYGIVSSSSYSSGTTTTTVNFTWDSGSLSNESLTVYLGILPVTGGAIPQLNTLLDISSSSGGQIKFPATQNASSNANTLDDYEEGTFTPALAIGGGTTGITYSQQVGRYTKIGNRVWIDIVIVLTSKGALTGNLTITGLPFTSSAATAYHATFAVQPYTFASGNYIFGDLAASSSAISLDNFAAGTTSGLTNTAINNTSQVNLSGSYEVS